MRMLISFANFIDKFNQRIGISVAWLALFMVLIQFSVVILRYAFGYSSIFMQESIIYMHGFLFLLGASYTLLHDGHVRGRYFLPRSITKKESHNQHIRCIRIFNSRLYLLSSVLTAIYS